MSVINNDEILEIQKNTKKFFDNIDFDMVCEFKNKGNVFDFEWLEKFENAVPRLDIIIKNAKVALVQVSSVEPIERTKRITVESVKDLAKHANYIRAVNEAKNTVEPEKILEVRNEETFDIYENRFLYTLVNAMENFILNMEDKIENIEITDNKVLEYKAKTKTNKERLSIEMRITSDALVNSIPDEKLKSELKKVKERIKDIKIYIGSWQKSDMMKSLSKINFPPVKSPLKKTNILLKNPNFKLATELWEYIQRYDSSYINKLKKNEPNLNDELSYFLQQAFLINHFALDSMFEQKRIKKRKISNYALIMIIEEIKHMRSLFEKMGIDSDDNKILNLIKKSLKNSNNIESSLNVGDIKKKFKNAMDEYIERTQEYL